MSIAGPTTNHDEIRQWEEKHQAVPTELLPDHLNHEPLVLRMMLPRMAADRKDIRVLSWEEFFTKFDLLGLTFVYDSNSSGYNELLQIDSRNPYRSARDQPIDPHNQGVRDGWGLRAGERKVDWIAAPPCYARFTP